MLLEQGDSDAPVPNALTMALPTCVAVSSGSEQPRQSGGTAGTGSPPSSAAWLPQCPGQRLSTIPGSQRAVGKQGGLHRTSPPNVFPAGFVPQALSKAAGNLEDGFPQRLKEKGLLLHLGDEALLEKTTGMECGQEVSIHRCCKCGWAGART